MLYLWALIALVLVALAAVWRRESPRQRFIFDQLTWLESCQQAQVSPNGSETLRDSAA